MVDGQVDQQNRHITLDNARAGYQAAIALWAYEGSLIWSKFTAMVYANTIVLATVGLLITSQKEFKLMRISLATLGIMLCVVWCFIMKRSFDFFRYWIYSAREIEETYLSPVETISRGGTFSKGERIEFKTKVPLCIDRAKLRGYRIEPVCYSIIAVFAIIYIVSFFQ